ncbi:MAG: 4'-phosphopantetheinyl transferase superfamily protein [Pirellulales bacterium]
MRFSLDRLPPISVDDTLNRPAGAVDLWCFEYESAVEDEQLAAEYRELLSEAERGRYERFYFDRDRLQYLATRALVRTVLSRYADVSPKEWRFRIDARGKPSVSGPWTSRPLHFNLSNTRGLVACAVSLGHERVGVDVERLDRRNDLAALANRYFCPTESRTLMTLDAAVRPRRFFDYWTLKESYIKARGLGLAIPLDSFRFQIARDEQSGEGLGEGGRGSERIDIEIDASQNDEASRWRFAVIDAPPRFAMAVGVDTGGEPLAVRAARVTPLRS